MKELEQSSGGKLTDRASIPSCHKKAGELKFNRSVASKRERGAVSEAIDTDVATTTRQVHMLDTLYKIT